MYCLQSIAFIMPLGMLFIQYHKFGYSIEITVQF